MLPYVEHPVLDLGFYRLDSFVVLTGAGISAESGVPTFRAPDGLWAQYDPMELATPEAFRRDPDLVWRWYSYRRRVIASSITRPALRIGATAIS